MENTLFQHPNWSRRVLGFQRRVKPVLKLGTVAIATRHAEAKEILARDDDFTVEIYTPKMAATVGPFLLGMQHTPIYDRDHEALQMAVPREDLPRIQTIIDGIVEEVLAGPGAAGRLDVVSDVAEGVPVQLSARYLGLTDLPDRSLVPLARAVFRNLFYNLRLDPAIAHPAVEAGKKLHAHLDGIIASRRSSSGADAAPTDDVLGRMLKMQADGMDGIDDVWIHTNLIGLLVGMLPLTSKVSSLAIDAMFDRPGLLAGAQAAAKAKDDDLLWRHIDEAMRFGPQTPGIFRTAAADFTIGAGSGRNYKIRKGTRILAGTQPAMFDPKVFPEPGKVRTDRPGDSYFTFGHGLHACFGRFISQSVQLPAIVKAVIERPGVRRAPGGDGKLKWSGPFPNSLHVEFQAG